MARKFAQGFSNSVITATHGSNRTQSAVLWGYMLLVWLGVWFAFRELRGASASGDPMATRLLLLSSVVLICYVVNIAGYAVYFTRLRFRLPLDVALTLVAAIGWYLRIDPQSSEVERAR
jgi:hypothetical protein